MLGEIISLQKSYGFIRNADGQHLYFNFKSLTTATEPQWLEIGSKVRFSMRQAINGPRAIYVTLIDKPDFELEEGALYIERAGKTFKTWLAGCEPELGPGQRILETVNYVTDYYPSAKLAIDEFRAKAGQAGANFARDCKTEVAIKLASGFALESYRCTGSFGVMVKPLKVKNPDELDSLNQHFSALIEGRLKQLRSFRKWMERSERLAG